MAKTPSSKTTKKKFQVSELIISDHSKRNRDIVIKLVGENQKRFDELMKFMLGEDDELARRASWPLSYIVREHPALVTKWLPKIIANLNRQGLHPGIYRNIFRFLQEIKIPVKYSSTILDLAYRYAMNASHPPAVRVFALTTAYNVVAEFPALASELRLVTEQLVAEDSKALKSRGKRVIRDLARISGD